MRSLQEIVKTFTGKLDKHLIGMIYAADPAFGKGDGIGNLSRSLPSTTL